MSDMKQSMKSFSARRPKLLVIGLDGATFQLIEPWAEAGFLPNVKRLMDKGVYGELMSVVNANSPQAWSSFMTGMNAGKHGIFYFTERIPGTYKVQFTNARSRQGVPFWKMIGDAGYDVGIMNVPVTWPPEPVNGWLVSGFDAPEAKTGFTYPESLAAELSEVADGYVIDLRLRNAVNATNETRVARDLVVMEEKRLKAAKHLAVSRKWDLLVTVFNASDRAQHWFWKHMDPSHPDHNPIVKPELRDAILNVYKTLDNAVGELVEIAGDDADVIVMSDHGFGPATNIAFYPNKWLMQQGFLSLKKGDGRRSFLQKLGRRLKTTVARNLGRNQKGMLKKLFPGLRSALDGYLMFSRIDWNCTKAFSDERYCSISLNVRGREPQGIVEPGEEYEALRSDIISRLYDLKGPSGEKVVEKVYRREELYSGPVANHSPDILIEWVDNGVRVKSSTTGDPDAPCLAEAVFEDQASGNHRNEGILIACGPSFTTGRIDGAHIYDLAPTILSIFGLPAVSEMDGKALRGIFITDVAENLNGETITLGQMSPAAVGVQTYAEDEETFIEERLRSLGYID